MISLTNHQIGCLIDSYPSFTVEAISPSPPCQGPQPREGRAASTMLTRMIKSPGSGMYRTSQDGFGWVEMVEKVAPRQKITVYYSLQVL